jgi:hypothetical protein
MAQNVWRNRLHNGNRDVHRDWCRVRANAQKPRCCSRPGNRSSGVARTVEIDTTSGPGFGFAQFKAYDFWASEVVLTLTIPTHNTGRGAQSPGSTMH